MRVKREPGPAVPRPAIAPVAWMAVAVCGGCAAGEALWWSVVEKPQAAARGAAALLALAVLLAAGFRLLARAAWSGGLVRRAAAVVPAVLKPVRAGLVLALAGLVAGAGLSALQGLAYSRQLRMVADCGAREWLGIVEADPMPGTYGTVVRVRITGGPLDGARVRVGWPEGTDVPELGRTVRFSAILKPVDVAASWGRRLARSGIAATGNAWVAGTGAWRPGPTAALYAWRSRVLAGAHAIPGAGGDLAEGIVLGDRRRLLGTDTEEDFRVLGLTHLVAVSGSHLALACGAVAFLGGLLKVRKRPLVVATVLAGAAYALVTGLAYSALRSLLMLAVVGVGQLAGRRTDGVASLAVAIIAVLVLEPWSVFDIGLQLSALAVAGLLLFGSLVDAWMTAGLRGVWRAVSATLALTLVAQFATLPVMAGSFGAVSLLAPVANALAGAPVSLALLLGLSGAIVSGAAPAVEEAALKTAAAVLEATAWCARGLATLPGAAMPVDSGWLIPALTLVVAAALWVTWPQPRDARAGARTRAAVLGLSVALALGPAPAGSPSIVMLDVGQGDAILVRDRGRAMLVDTGADGLALKKALARHGIRRIDVLVLTHAHADHTAGGAGLVGVTEVGWMGVPGIERERAQYPGAPRDFLPGDSGWRGPEGAVVPLLAGDSWTVGRLRVQVAWPVAGLPEDTATNNTSVVLYVSMGEFDAVLTGDAEGEVQEAMRAGGAMRDVEVLKVPHHGSVNGLTEAGLAGWAPALALISVGQDNDFGHPSPSTLAMLKAAGVQALRTDAVGDVCVEIGEHGYRTTTGRRGSVTALRVRMSDTAGRATPAGSSASTRRSECGCQEGQGRGSASHLPHLRGRGSAARPRPPPPAGPHSRGGGPRLQLRGVQRRDRGRVGGGCRRQHAAVRLGAAPCGGAGRGQDERAEPGGACRVRHRPGSERVPGTGSAQDAQGLEAAQGGRGIRLGV